MTSLSLSLRARTLRSAQLQEGGRAQLPAHQRDLRRRPEILVKKYFDLSMHGQAQERKQKYVAKGWVVKDKK